MRRRAFTIFEVVAWLSIMTTVSLVTDQLMRVMFRISAESRSSIDRSSLYDKAARRLQADVWSAWKVVATGNETLELYLDDREVTWRIEFDGALVREEFPGSASAERWSVKNATRFSRSATGVVLHWNTGREILFACPAFVMHGGTTP